MKTKLRLGTEKGEIEIIKGRGGNVIFEGSREANRELISRYPGLEAAELKEDGTLHVNSEQAAELVRHVSYEIANR